MEKLIIEAKRPEDLSERDFIGIHEVMQDMWASETGIGELAQCQDCGKMISKEEAFKNLPAELAQDTVAQVFRILWTDEVPCTACGSKETRLIYGPKNLDKIKRRALSSVDAFIVLCRSETMGIVGFEEGYIDSLERIFELDLHDHYGRVGLPEIERRVESILWYYPDEILLMSAIGFLKPYRSFQNLFRTIEQYAHMLPESRRWMPGMVEYGRGGTTHRMNSDVNRSVSLGIEDDPELRAKMTAVGEKYECDLILYPDVVGMHKDFFTKGMRHYLQASKASSARRSTNRRTETSESLAV